MRILIVDDHPVMRFGVRQLIERHWPQATIGEAASLAEALEQVRASPWDLAVLDLSLPDTSGVEGLVQLRRAAPTTRVLMLSMHDEAAYAARAAARCRRVSDQGTCDQRTGGRHRARAQ